MAMGSPMRGVVGAALVAVAAGCTPAERADGAAAEGGEGLEVRAAPAMEEAAMSGQEAHNRLTEAEREAGWRLLFDGETTEGWRGYGRDDMPDGWQAVDGTLARVARAGDVITVEQFGDFELELEWRVEPGGNSGIFYRAIEGEGPIYMYAPEYQILDDAGHADGQSPLTSAGSNYGLHAVPRGIVRPAREWNRTRIVVHGNHVEHWLNGERVVEYELASEDWARRVAESKFAEWPEYGLADAGHIGLQDHGDPVAYRNVKIRPIP